MCPNSVPELCARTGGMELKDVCDGSSRIVIRLEMQEGADRMFHMKYIHEANYFKSTACTIRLLEP